MTQKKPTQKNTKKPAASRKPRRPAKAKRVAIRAAAADAVGQVENLQWLWKKTHDEQKTEVAAKEVNLDARRYAVWALVGGWVMVFGAVTDLLPFGQIMNLI